MLNPRLLALLDQSRAEFLEIYPPLLMGFYKKLREEGADDNTAYDLTAQLFQHHLNKGSVNHGK